MSKNLRLTRCLGLGQSGSPLSLVCEPDTGRFELARAVNVEVVSGRIRRRPGYAAIGEAGFTTLFSDGANLYGAREGGIWLIPGQGEPRLLRGDLTPEGRVVFLTVGDTVYFTNGFETGRLRDGAALPWGGGTYPGPDRSGRFVPPPPGKHLAHFAGRIWIASGNLVRFTEGAGLFDWVDGVAGFLPPATGQVRFLRAVGGGLYIGDDAGVVFAAGYDPKKAMTFKRVCPTPPLPGSDATLAAGRREAVAGQTLAGDAALWAGTDGVYRGEADGRVTRLAAAAIPPGKARAVATNRRYLLFINA
ncbi:conserved hypothetical protein [Solidesulfovibrio fructosivorans JJ]]|uniref:NHL repeat containing protein n=1 Tax=Solidesulfovibrio fructosivorans JJ] TaxID=596151 RepID=E1JS53_SOLFR|nr:hypothetical protein [Solidesulfovibrio fructosivorans]EFL52822.1 conserved hypothetical protein [Solidesulfovibrio fructosivorans JJ]]